MKEYCKYVVVDLQTGYALVNGEKYKDFSGMPVDSIFRRRFLFWQKIRQYYKLKTVGGRTCVIVYWVGGKGKRDVNSVIYYDGIRLRLRGFIYVPGRYIGINVLRSLNLPLCTD